MRCRPCPGEHGGITRTSLVELFSAAAVGLIMQSARRRQQYHDWSGRRGSARWGYTFLAIWTCSMVAATRPLRIPLECQVHGQIVTVKAATVARALSM